ncbi:MAG TPA: hypothetical protein VNE86_02195 [Nitrososphaerales archaeon]|nr:hypothetical protein [Nitrososphaerales archaeon]
MNKILVMIVIALVLVGIVAIGYILSPTAHVTEQVVVRTEVTGFVCTFTTSSPPVITTAITYTTYITANNITSPFGKTIVTTQTTQTTELSSCA